jgi:deoxyadenosine/deoxycytidine kinase
MSGMSELPPKIICIEGNIGTGKTTFVKRMKDHFKEREDIMFLEEPVDLWMTCRDKEGNILDHYYKDQVAYGFKFQMLAYISRLSILKRAIESGKYKYIVSERSLHTDKNIFCKMLHDSGKIDDIGFQIYNMWFDEFYPYSKNCSYIYLRADPETSFKRVEKRARHGETIPLEYLKECHRYHDEWLKDSIIFDANVEQDETTNWLNIIDKLTTNN